jgi:hypothetical protein
MSALLPPYKSTLWTERHAEGWDGTHQEYPPGPFGLLYRCHHCRKVYGSRSGARKHENLTGHVVLRTDWLRNDYWPHVLRERPRGLVARGKEQKG